jgi:hypothetical protein
MLLAKPKYDAEAFLKTYGLFIYGNIHYIRHSFHISVLKIAKLWPRLVSAFLYKSFQL